MDYCPCPACKKLVHKNADRCPFCHEVLKGAWYEIIFWRVLGKLNPMAGAWQFFFALSIFCLLTAYFFHDIRVLRPIAYFSIPAFALFGFLTFVFGISAFIRAVFPKKIATGMVWAFWLTIVGIFLVYPTMHRGDSMRERAYRASAKSAGRNAKLAEEVFWMEGEKGARRYTDDLNQLLSIDRNLTDDEAVTFEFLHASESMFVLYTEHGKAKGKHYFDSE